MKDIVEGVPLVETLARDFQPGYADVGVSGPNLLPAQRIQVYSDVEFEEFTEECTHALKMEYSKVMRTGGAGDLGLDIVAFTSSNGFKSHWDNYQCKHCDHPLYPSDIVKDLGKLCYYTFKKDYTTPRHYYIVGSQGLGTTLSRLVRGNPEDLKNYLIENWESGCQTKITSHETVLLDGDFGAYVNTFDFSIVDDKTILGMLEYHRQTPYYNQRFGGGLPKRPSVDVPPEEIADIEVIYIKKLMQAYSQYLQLKVCSQTDVEGHSTLRQHLRSARIQFYCAESLQAFSRDNSIPGEFRRLQHAIYDGVENIILNEHENGYECVKAVVQEAFKIQLDSHPLRDRIEPRDRAGICHQLANEGRLSWVKYDKSNG